MVTPDKWTLKSYSLFILSNIRNMCIFILMLPFAAAFLFAYFYAYTYVEPIIGLWIFVWIIAEIGSRIYKWARG